jgi:hypothetical protein
MKSFDILLVSVTSKVTIRRMNQTMYRKFDVLYFFAIDCSNKFLFLKKIDTKEIYNFLQLCFCFVVRAVA